MSHEESMSRIERDIKKRIQQEVNNHLHRVTESSHLAHADPGYIFLGRLRETIAANLFEAFPNVPLTTIRDTCNRSELSGALQNIFFALHQKEINVRFDARLNRFYALIEREES